MDIVNKVKQVLGLESLQEKLDRYTEISKSYTEVENELDQLSQTFFIEKSRYVKRLAEPENEEIQDRIKAKWNKFLEYQREDIRKAKKQYDSLKKEKERIESDERIQKALKEISKSEQYEKLKKAYQNQQISPDTYNTIIKALTKSEKVKYADFILFNEEGKLLLLKRSAWEDDNKGAWVIPGGHVDPGEDFETAAKRELREESGYNVDKCENVGSYEDDKCHIEYFQSSINTKEQQMVLDVFESRDYKWINLDELDEYEMVFNMKDNLMKILKLPTKQKEVIKKGSILGEYGDNVIKYLQEVMKGDDKYKTKLERLEARRTDKQYTKKEADYVDSYLDQEHQCEFCEYWRKPESCIKVKGKIASEGHCKFWEYPEKEKSEKSDIIKSAILQGIIPVDLIEKAKSGVYKNTPENRKLGRVGQKYGDKKEEQDYLTKVKQYAEQIIAGQYSLKRLSPEEEQGRLLGGKRNVEATIICGAVDKADGAFKWSSEKERQESLLKQYANKEGILFSPSSFDRLIFIGEGGESRVFMLNDREVVKINHYPFEDEPLKALDKISIHNYLFPETKYEVIGFTEKELFGDKLFSIVVKQPTIKHYGENVTADEVLSDLKERGFRYDEDIEQFISGDYFIGDTHPGNVLRSEDGDLIYIDPMIELNTEEAGYGGKRKLGKINLPVEKSFEGELQKAYLLGIVDEDVIEKAWKKHPIGTIITRKDGQKYKKVSETGNSAQDWKLVSKDKTKVDEAGEAKEHQHKPEELKEAAKQTSETALQNAIKQSDDPKVRQAAHEELNRREKEEKPQEESDRPSVEAEKKSSKKEATSAPKKEKLETKEEIEEELNKRKGEFVLELAEFIGANEKFDFEKYKDILRPYMFQYDVYRYWSDPSMKVKDSYSTSKNINAIRQMVEQNELDDGVITKHSVSGFDPYFVLQRFKQFAPENEHSFIDDIIRSNSYQQEIVTPDKLKVTPENTIGKVQDQEVKIDKKEIKKGYEQWL